MNEKRIQLDNCNDRNLYRLILQFLLGRAETFSLVIQPRNPLGELGERINGELAGDLISEEVVDSWPGTILLGGKAILRRYPYNPHTKDIIDKYASQFADWQQPHLPEDIAFYRNESDVMVESTGHEGYVTLYFTDDETKDMHKHYPEFRLPG